MRLLSKRVCRGFANLIISELRSLGHSVNNSKHGNLYVTPLPGLQKRRLQSFWGHCAQLIADEGNALSPDIILPLSL